MSNELIAIDAEKHYKKEFEKLMSNIISSFINPADDVYPEKEKVIVQFYMAAMKSSKESLPDIRDILAEVEEHNFESISELASLDMEYGMVCPEHSHEDVMPYFINPCDGDESEESMLYTAYFNAWYEDYSAEFMYEMPYFISTVLSRLNMCYSINDSGDRPIDYLDDLPQDIAVCMHDAQNLLLEEWHLAVMSKDKTKEYFCTKDDIVNLLKMRFYSKPEGSE